MARVSRKHQPGEYFHVLNRGSLRARLFQTEGDYRAFVAVLATAVDRFQLPLLSYCVMPNHWHLVIRPETLRHLSVSLQWLTTTHAVRWCKAHPRPGPGPVYQGRFRSIAVEPDFHLARVCRYVERNARAADLVGHAEDWYWGSAYQRRAQGTGPALVPLTFMPDDEWLEYLNAAYSDLTVPQAIRLNRPFGGDDWIRRHYGDLPRYKRGRPKQMGTDPI